MNDWVKWVVVGAMIFVAIVAVANMDRGQPDEPEDEPQVIDEDEFE